MFNPQQEQQMLAVARAAISFGLAEGEGYSVEHEGMDKALLQVRASFVTLNIKGRLRGCIGTLQAREPLIDSIAHNAHSAAFYDSRFSPLRPDELDELEIHISVLGESSPLSCNSEQDLLQQLRPHVDGIILREGQHQATFLPAVWQQLSTPSEFIEQLKLKAGLNADYWSANIEIERYTVESFT